jgi:outer membrane protein assembly factor BamB
MKSWRAFALLLLCCMTGVICCKRVQAGELQQEYVTTTPVLADGVLYIASTTFPDHRGHLRAIDLLDTFPVTLWDAADKMPQAGIGAVPGDLTSGDPPTTINPGNLYRSIFTNLGSEQLSFSLDSLTRLESAMAVDSLLEGELLLHAVRGRRGGTVEFPAGFSDDPKRLWSISRSSPVLVGRSPVNNQASQRDRVIYAGGEDGMLHAFFVSHWDADSSGFPRDDAEAGAELWAYLPGSFLPHLKGQPLEEELGELAVHLDGPPVVRELFLDLDGDGLCRWQTLLVATGTLVQGRRSNLFVLDITDPYQPELLWEGLLPGNGVGRTRGLTIGSCDALATSKECIYLTTDSIAGDEATAVHALALSLDSGQLLWQFTAPYPINGSVTEATPAVPALMALSGGQSNDTLVFGDMVGRLWALDLLNGRAHGDAPVYVVPGGAREPIGAGVAIRNRLAIFGTGGVESAAAEGPYALYAVEILPGGGRLRWRYPLLPGERIWETPQLDASGNVVFATARDYLSLVFSGETTTHGRLVALNESGEEKVRRNLNAATVGRVVTAPGVVVAVSLTGEVTQLGAASRLRGPVGGEGSVKVLSWRQR